MAYWILKGLLSPIFFLLWRVRIEGAEHVPADGPAVLAANHQSFCDSFFLPLVLRRRLTYVAKAEYFESWRTSWFFRAVGQIPMQREGGSASQRALSTAVGVLEGGQLLGIYPEGTRAPDERLHKGHTGAARLSLTCRVPVIPVGIVGTRCVQPPGRRLMRPFHTVTIRFGPPVGYLCEGTPPVTGRGEESGVVADRSDGDAAERFSGLEPTERLSGLEPTELRGLTDALMGDIARLSGQEYVHLYAKRTGAS